MEPRTAFSRAWEILDNYRSAKYSALTAAVLAAVLSVTLLGILALYVDLLISQGKIPAYHELAEQQRLAFAAGLSGLIGDSRTSALQAVGAGSDRSRELIGEFDTLSANAQEQLWRAYVWHHLKATAGDAAADTYAERARATDLRHDVTGFGLLSLVVRTQGLPVSRVIGWFASWNPWTWRPDLQGTPNCWYLTGLGFLAIALLLARAAFINLMYYSAAVAAVAVSTRLRRAVYHHTYRLGTLAIRSSGPGEVVHLFSRHIDAIHDAIQAKLSSQFFGPVEVALLLMFALAIHFWLAAAFLLTAVIVLLIGGQLATSFRRTAGNAERRAGARMTLMRESLMMMRLVKSNAMELFNQSRVERQLAEYTDARLRRARSAALFRPLLWFLGAVSVLVLLYVAGLIVLSAGLGTANVFVLAATLLSAYWPIQSWQSSRRKVWQGRESAVAVYELLDRPREVGQVVGAEFLQGVSKGVEFREVSLREPSSGRMLLEGASLRIGAGERVGLVGTDETEKHALIYLLARFLDPTAGEVRIDDKNLKWLTLDSLRAQIGLILQPNLIFNDTVVNNIGCGDATYSIPQIIEAAKIAHAHHFIQKLPYGYETPIGELGSSLRVGEQYRIALARAILRDPAMFVIEEPVTALDDDTKSLLDDTFSRVLPGKTVLFLPHRVSTIRSCDRLYLIHQGRVEAVGQHRELIAKSDLYRHFHYLEFNEFAEHV